MNGPSEQAGTFETRHVGRSENFPPRVLPSLRDKAELFSILDRILGKLTANDKMGVLQSRIDQRMAAQPSGEGRLSE